MDLLNLNKMKGKLIKQGNEYFLRSLIKDIPSSINVYHKISETEGEFGFGEHSGKLSIQNCDEIFGVVDVEKLAKEETRKFLGHDVPENIMLFIAHSKMFQVGFQKAIEILDDKKFSISDMEKLMFATIEFTEQEEGETYPFLKNYIQSLQQPTEIDVEVVMDKIPADLAPGGWDVFPRLDKEGCIILKKK
jgi:hypothetical protein